MKSRFKLRQKRHISPPTGLEALWRADATKIFAPDGALAAIALRLERWWGSDPGGIALRANLGFWDGIPLGFSDRLGFRHAKNVASVVIQKRLVVFRQSFNSK